MDTVAIMAVRQPTRAETVAAHIALPRDGDRQGKRECAVTIFTPLTSRGQGAVMGRAGPRPDRRG